MKEIFTEILRGAVTAAGMVLVIFLTVQIVQWWARWQGKKTQRQ